MYVEVNREFIEELNNIKKGNNSNFYVSSSEK